MPELSPQHNQLTYSVSEISGAVKRVVEDNFGYVRVRGEISGFKLAASGHAYMTLRDDKSVLDAVCWKGTVGKLSFRPEDGLEVACVGRVTTYPGRSKYQLVIEHMEPAGVGALMALLEQRKKQFAAEGLFDESRKKAKPFLPQTIGVVTSPTGAVIRDILHRLADRFPVHVIVWPVLVQGEGAAEQIADAIQGFNVLPESITKPDLLIVARGGGSIEDLWAFNEEIVVRAAADSAISLISAVGHETDTTLIDYVSDLRAPTPTGAAELAVPVRSEWQYSIEETGLRLSQSIQRLLQQREDAVITHARALPNPKQLLENASQRLDDWAERLTTSLPKLLEQKQAALTYLSGALRPAALQQDITRYDQKLSELSERLKASYLRQLGTKSDRVSALNQLLESLNYKQVLKRGFAMVKGANDQLITSSNDAQKESSLTLTFHDGEVKTSP
jgi:exodeoxyribonuclease VII large subunit